MRRPTLMLAALCVAVAAGAQCQPSGRPTFAAGLEALDRADLDAAAAAFVSLVKAQPDCAEARNNLAVVLLEQGRLTEAAAQLRRAVELRPDYNRARLNLERVETLLAARPPAALSPAPPPAPIEAEHLRTTDPVPLPPTAAAPGDTSSPAPPSLVVLEPDGATACAIDQAHNHLCVLRRTDSGITRAACYAMLSAAVAADVRWLTASDVNAKRIRLVDETGRKRLKIVAAGAAPGSDIVRLSSRDFAELSTQVVPWRTGWMIIDEAHAVANSAAIGAAVHSAMERWRRAWEQKDFDAYTASYSAAFVPQAESDLAHWRTRKRRLFEEGGALKVQLRAPSLFVVADDRVIAAFEQRYRSGPNAFIAAKVLRWRREGERWTITAETVLSEAPAPRNSDDE